MMGVIFCVEKFFRFTAFRHCLYKEFGVSTRDSIETVKKNFLSHNRDITFFYKTRLLTNFNKKLH